MSETTKRQFTPTQAHLTQTHLPYDAENELSYGKQLLGKIQELFSAQPEISELLIGVDLNSFGDLTEQTQLTSDLRALGMNYQVVSRGNRNFENCGALITRTNSETQP